MIARKLFFFKEPKKSASLSSPSQLPLELPISLPLQDRPCLPLALPEGELSQIPPGQGGADLPEVVRWGWGAGKSRASLGKRCTNVPGLSS